MSPRYAIGIDLGTTNSVIAAIDLEKAKGSFPEIETIDLYQGLDEEHLGTLKRLPSFCFQPTQDQRATLPDYPYNPEHWVIGQAAQNMGRRVTGRLVSSAKSWLCHSRMDPEAKILPWGAEDLEKMSPVTATAYILEHLKVSWELSPQGKQAPLKDQVLTITLPASFDQRARQFTLEAAKKAGMEHARLLEEPQAAFYNWISLRRGRWGKDLGDARRVLICDIGGGTSDFSLIDCHPEGKEMKFERVAVGKHLLLGGDNIDLSIAHYAESKISTKGSKLKSGQWQLLAQLARQAKEDLLSGVQDQVRFVLPGSGTKLIGGLRQTELNAEELQKIVLDGFFPKLKIDDYQAKTQKSGLTDLGLPYEREAAMTWHILDFLNHHDALKEGFPQRILFNGGTLEPDAIRHRILETLRDHSGVGCEVLESDSLAEAVARGAAYYTYAQIRGGLKIGGGSPRAYYLGIEGEKALCVIPKGSEAHEKVHVQLNGLHVTTNQPVSFPLLQSDQYSEDEAGSLREFVDDEEHGRLIARMRFGKGEKREIPVAIEGELTELDTLNLKLQATQTPHDWKLEFDLRADSVSEEKLITTENLFNDEQVQQAAQTFKENKSQNPIKALEKQLQTSRSQWSIQDCRTLADALLDHNCSEYCQHSPEKEKIWLNALGFSLRPGFGHVLDESRRGSLWKYLREGPMSSNQSDLWAQWAILFRRIAPGLESGRQSDLYQRIKKKLYDKKGRPVFKAEALELWRMFVSFEHLDPKHKKELGKHLFESLQKEKKNLDFLIWALGRLGSRQPLVAGPDKVLEIEVIQPWAQFFMQSETTSPHLSISLLELTRKCGQRELDWSENDLKEVRTFFEERSGLSEEIWQDALEAPQARELFEQSEILGDSLPKGLSLKN